MSDVQKTKDYIVFLVLINLYGFVQENKRDKPPKFNALALYCAYPLLSCALLSQWPARLRLKGHLYLPLLKERNGTDRQQLETFSLKINFRSQRITAIFYKMTDMKCSTKIETGKAVIITPVMQAIEAIILPAMVEGVISMKSVNLRAEIGSISTVLERSRNGMVETTSIKFKGDRKNLANPGQQTIRKINSNVNQAMVKNSKYCKTRLFGQADKY
uniref:Uncharacterized protein n=1 Tax=Romanomermis culicivorax TaxID=13658 RepID=A0A915HQL5_ROMCU